MSDDHIDAAAITEVERERAADLLELFSRKSPTPVQSQPLDNPIGTRLSPMS
jgi:hypothetical protein